MPTMTQRILFRMTRTHLLVANTGRCFSKAGLKAICYPATSSKGSDLIAATNDLGTPKDWVEEVLKNRVETFEREPEALHSASNMAALTAKDYSGRVFLEMLQNAVDAGRSEQIGHKGIGFRSVLNDSEVVEIHSGGLHVRWSQDDARAALARFNDLPKRLPMLDLPTWVEPDGETLALLKDPANQYDTIVRLTIRPEGMEHVRKEWDAISSDPSLLLFIDGDLEIKWERTHTDDVTWSRQGDNRFVVVAAKVGDNSRTELLWRRFNCGQASAAYRVGEGENFHPSDVTTPRLRCYFPAAQAPHPFPNLFLHHSGFELQSNREAVQPNEERMTELASAIVLAAESVNNAADLLDLLKLDEFNHCDDKKIETQVWKAAHSALIKVCLPALNNRNLVEIKTCPKSEDLPSDWLDKSRLSNWQAFLQALQNVRMNGLAGLPVLPPGIENEIRENTIRVFNPKCSFTKTDWRQQPWAPVEDSSQPVSSSFKIFLPHQGPVLNPPQGIEVRFLNAALGREFSAACGKNLESFLTATLGVLKFSALSVVDHAVLPVLTANQAFEPNSALIQFLRRLRDADQGESKKPVESFDWFDPVRRELIQKLRIRCQGRSRPVLEIYAGEKWTGNRFLEDTFSDQRGFLDIEPHADQEQRKLEENFWKWLGVAWCPKVLPVLKGIVVEKQHGEGLAWVNGSFQGQFFQMPHALEGWSEYCGALSCDVRFTRWTYFPRLKANWTIDGGTSALAQVGAFGVIAKHWPTYRGWLRARIGYSSNEQINRDNHQNGELPSHLAWLFQTTKWVPCAGDLHCGCNVFQPSGPVAKELKAFVPRLDLPENEADETRMPLPPEFLNTCGIRNGWKEVNDYDWRLWLGKASQMQPSGSSGRQERDAIRGLYRALLNHRKRKTGDRQNEEDAAPLERVALWSIERGDDAHENWHLRTPNEAQPFFVDRPDVADVNLPGLRTFPVRLDGLADKARQHLDLRPLSEALSGEPTEEGSEKLEFASVTTDRLHELMAYLKLDGSQNDDAELRLALESVTLRESNRLKVQFSVDDEAMGEPLLRNKFQKFDKETRRWIVFVNRDCRDDERGEAFAEALLLSSGQDTDKALNVRELLRCKAEDLPERMIKLGVAPETAEALRNKRDERVEQPTSSPAPPSTKEETTTAAPQVPEQKPAVPPAIRPPSGNGPTLTSGAPCSNDRSSGSSSERRPRSPTYGQRSPSSRPHPEQGLKAQRWLFERVKEWCEQQQLPKPVEELDDVDITILLSPPFLIEAKRIDSSTIHWSRNQIEKAMANPGRYAVALLRPNEVADGYEVFWVTEPLNDFLALQRHVEWTWQVQKGTNFPDNSWDEPDNKPSKPANSFNAEISVHDAWLVDLPKGIEHLAQILSVAPKP